MAPMLSADRRVEALAGPPDPGDVGGSLGGEPGDDPLAPSQQHGPEARGVRGPEDLERVVDPAAEVRENLDDGVTAPALAVGALSVRGEPGEQPGQVRLACVAVQVLHLDLGPEPVLRVA